MSSFLDIGEWIKATEHREFTAQIPELVKNEDMGRVLSCIGECRHYRGQGVSFARFRTRLMEGDDFETGPGSMAYLYFHGGHLLRLSENASVALKEINLAQDKELLVIRVNFGHVFFIPRENLDIKKTGFLESDRSFLPIRPLEANLLPHMVSLTEEVFSPQQVMDNYVEVINQKIKTNGFKENPKLYVLFLVSNMSIWSRTPLLEIYHKTGSFSFFKNYSLNFLYQNVASEMENERFAKVIFRGFNNLDLNSVPKDVWHRVDPQGKELGSLSEKSQVLDLSSHFVQRPYSVLNARESFYADYDLDKFPLTTGHFIWSQERFFVRLKQIMDISRRWESYNLPLKVEKEPREDIQQLTKEWVHYFHQKSLEDQAIDLGKGALVPFERPKEKVSKGKKLWYLEAQLKGNI